MTNFIKNFWNDEEGATAIEYGLIAGLIAVVIIVSVGDIGKKLDAVFKFIDSELGKAAPTTTGSGSGSGS